MVLNVVGSNPTGHPERAVSKETALFFVDIIDKTVQWDRTHGFATDEVAEPRRRIPLARNLLRMRPEQKHAAQLAIRLNCAACFDELSSLSLQPAVLGDRVDRDERKYERCLSDISLKLRILAVGFILPQLKPAGSAEHDIYDAGIT